MRRRGYGSRWPGSVRKLRCDYCTAPAAAWFWYTTSLPYRGPYRQSGTVAMNAATCAEHEGCTNWTGVLALHPEGRIERTAEAGA